MVQIFETSETSPMNSPNNSNNFEISLYDLLKIAIQHIKLITITTFSFSVIAIVFSMFIENEYTSDILLIPASKEAYNLADRYGDVASLVGVNIGDKGASPVKEAIAILQSKKFLNLFVQKYNYKPILFKDRWNSDSQEWIPQHPNILQKIKSFIFPEAIKNNYYKGTLGEPSIWELTEVFKENLGINENSLDGTISISFTHTDPQFAKIVVNNLIMEINENLRADFIERAQNTIIYLENEIKTVQVVELRNTLVEIIGENLNNIALAKAQEAYVFKTLDPAIIPEEKSSPNRLLILIFSTVTGMVFGIMISFVLNFRRTGKI